MNQKGTGSRSLVALQNRKLQLFQDILQLPHVAVINPQMNSILNTYLETFEVIHSSPPIRTEDLCVLLVLRVLSAWNLEMPG